MGQIIKESVIKVFILDTLIFATQGIQLKVGMMKKHLWSVKEFNEYQTIYMEYIIKRLK